MLQSWHRLSDPGLAKQLAVDLDEDGFIQATNYSTGNLHDLSCFTGLFTGEESEVLVLFTSTNRTKSFVKNYPGLAFGIDCEAQNLTRIAAMGSN